MRALQFTRTLVLALANFCGAPDGAAALEPTSIDFWSCDNVTSSFALSGDRLIAAGGFGDWGPSTGQGVVVDRWTGAPDLVFPEVAGSVEVSLPDGRGGFLIGGSFVAVGGVPRSGLAHILRDGSLGPWAPRVAGEVFSMANHGGVVYVAGSFWSVNGVPRRHLAAVDTLFGNLLAWDPSPNDRVQVVLADSTGLFVGGEFDSIAGTERWALARFEGDAGPLSAWDPRVGYRLPESVHALLRIGETLYLGGTFWQVGPSLRRNVAAVDLTTGLPTAWNPDVDQPYSRANGSAVVKRLIPGEGTIYIGGKFRTVGGVTREALAEVDVINGALTGWDPKLVGYDYPEYIFARIDDIELDGSSLWIAGYFPGAGGQVRTFAARLDRATGDALPWNPELAGWARTLTLDSARVFLGGYFRSRGVQRFRPNLIVFRWSDLSIDSLAIENDGWSIESVATKGDTLYAIGSFTSLGGAPCAYLGAVDLRTGRALGWHADLNGYAWKLRLIADELYVCGEFTSVAGQPRSRVARFDTRTGELSPWSPLPDWTVRDVAVHGDIVYLCGTFDRVGSDSSRRIAAVDRVDGSFRGPRFNLLGSPEALVVVDSTLFVAGVSYSPTDATRYPLLALDRHSGQPSSAMPRMTWSKSTSAVLHALERVGDTLYFGGAVDTVAGRYQAGAGAIHVRTSQLLDWNPGFRFAGHEPDAGVIWGIQRMGDLLAVGGRFAVAAGMPAGGIALFSLADQDSGSGPGPPPEPGTLAPSVGAISPNPVVHRATVQFHLPRAASVRLQIFDLAGRRVRALLEDDPRAAGVHEVEFDSTGLARGVYWCRLESGGGHTSRKFVVLE